MVKRSKWGRDRVRVVRGVRGKAQITNVCSMIVTIRNTCWVFDELFHLVGNRKRVGFYSSHVSRVGTKPFSVVYIEVPKNEDFSIWV